MSFIYLHLCLFFYSWRLSKAAVHRLFLEKLSLKCLQSSLENSNDGVIYLVLLPAKVHNQNKNSQGRRHRGLLGGGMAHPLFCVAKRKKVDKGKKERVSERLKFENISCRPTVVADNTFQRSTPHCEIHFAGPEIPSHMFPY